MTTEFDEEGAIVKFTLYSPPDLAIEQTINAILPAGSDAADVPLILLFSSGGLEINIEVGETPHDALLRWKAT